MNIFEDFQTRVGAIIQSLVERGRLPAGLNLQGFLVEPPREAAHGDLSTNAAMVYAREAKAAGSSPRELAIELAAALAEQPDVDQAEVAGPGFINIRLKPAVYDNILRSVLSDGAAYGRGTSIADDTVNVEYVSANPTGPMHVGHARGAVFGDALCSLLQFAGRDVTREYYINDAGAQVDVLARSAYLRYREALGEDIGPIPEGYYPGEYLIETGQALAERDGRRWLERPDGEWLPPVREFAVAQMLALIREDLAGLG